jgi:hypothetical protein
VWLATAPHQRYDRRLEIRRQAVPARDKLCEARIGADIVQAQVIALDASVMLENGLRNQGRPQRRDGALIFDRRVNLGNSSAQYRIRRIEYPGRRANLSIGGSLDDS